LAALTALIFLFAGPRRAPRPKPKKGKPAKPPPLPARGRREWTLLALAMGVVASLLSWLYAGIDGFPLEEPVAYLASAAVLVALGLLTDKKARTLESNANRWMFFSPIFFELGFLSVALTGVFLGSSTAGFLLIPFGFLAIFAIMPVVAALPLEPGSGSGSSSYSSSSYSSSSYSSSSSSSSSSY